MLVYRCIQEADNEIGLVGIMDELEKKYQKDWKRSTVCTFIAVSYTHLDVYKRQR